MTITAHDSLEEREEVRLGNSSLSEPSANESIDSSKLNYYARYFGDPQARLFWHEQDLLLGVLPPYGKFFINLMDSHILDELFSARLLNDLRREGPLIAGFDAVYRLHSTPRITYWHEWSPRMWRAASLRLIELFIKLAELGLTLRNPHPWNVLFDGKGFSYANAGTIVEIDLETFRRSYEKVARYFVRPLLLVEHGFEHTARRLTEDFRDGVLQSDVNHLGCTWAEWDAEGSLNSIVPFLEEVSTGIESMSLRSTAARWIDYFATDCDFGPGTSWTRKQEVLTSLLQRQNIESVLDLGTNTGYYARLAAQKGSEVIAADFDPALVDMAYVNTQESDAALYPVVLDFIHPASGQGVNYRWFPPATERLKADLVLCFALAHHMVFGKYRLDFEQIANGVRNFSNGRALVEYVGRERVRPSEWRPDADRWYTPEEFANALGRHFPHVEILPPAKDGRRLLVCGPYGGVL